MTFRKHCILLGCSLVFAGVSAAHGQASSQVTPLLRKAPANKNPEKLAAGPVKENPKDGLKYVWIPPGTFQMGCSPGDSECLDDEKPAHPVTLTKGFWIGQTEVTVGAYKRFASDTRRGMPSPPSSNIGWGKDAMPIVNVSWDDSQAYCTWAGGRLPTEAEWEYAARGESGDARYGPLDEVAWYGDNSGPGRLDSERIWREDRQNYFNRLSQNGNHTHEVGQKRANGFGLFDTLGNVWEWVHDWYNYDYYSSAPGADPPGASSAQYRVLRGGSWFEVASFARVSARYRSTPGGLAYNVGCRCVREVVGP